MIARRSAAAVALCGIVAVSLPPVASAAPVIPSLALLTAGEFPAGSTGYAAGHRAPSTGVPDHNESLACSTLRSDLEKRLRATASAEASALRGRSALLVAVLDRPLATPMADIVTRCGSPGESVIPQAIPGDLQRLGPRVMTTGTDTIQGTADVRGATVFVSILGADTAPDRDAFWQVLRAQVAKVERQP